MQRAIRIVSGLALATVIGSSALAHSPSTKPAARNVTQANVAQPQTAKPAKPAKAAPKSDADIQSCIEQKLGADAKLKDQGFTAAVSGGVATFTGSTKDGSSKGGVNGIAKGCGAKKVVNNISVEKAPKPAKASKPVSK
ncbi:MAG TPA: BON domain-containing protein [Blastocatellia bacterium]|jgi:osmotically-inducible protein OsmY|nr:BON domain-containing protein [Blastocatellia bacterium]